MTAPARTTAPVRRQDEDRAARPIGRRAGAVVREPVYGCGELAAGGGRVPAR
ncbi:hypothetical protein [Streptomyces sp. NPDC048665]|uniref:hypothetical protein n=1 Tax=Streptomyces sp. NPDC048665 TaxID=3155490 RepID=UPI001E0201FE|nr:hypothetical protein [Streptomyces sp. tea 10]